MLFSAKRRRRRLGIRKATPKASAKSLVPRKCAFVASLMTPRMREISVRNESFMPDFTMFWFFFSNFSVFSIYK